MVERNQPIVCDELHPLYLCLCNQQSIVWIIVLLQNKPLACNQKRGYAPLSFSTSLPLSS